MQWICAEFGSVNTNSGVTHNKRIFYFDLLDLFTYYYNFFKVLYKNL